MISNLVPQSIKSPQTEAYDLTWEDRLYSLDIDKLIVNIESERDPIKLEYWLQMFSIDTSIFDFSGLSEAQRKAVIGNWLDIIVHSGTEYSIIKMGQVLGATQCYVSYGDDLRYDGSALHNGLYFYDGGAMYSRFSILVDVVGIPLTQRPDFELKFRKLMRAIQPIRIYIKLLNFI